MLDGRVYDLIQRIEKIDHAHRQTAFRVMATIIGHIYVGVSEMEDLDHTSGSLSWH
jgi:hypothetical protein